MLLQADVKKRKRYTTEEERQSAIKEQRAARYDTPEKKAERAEYARNRRKWIKENNPEKYNQLLEKQKQAYYKDKEKAKTRNKEWVKEHKERDRELKRLHYHKHKSRPDRIKYYLIKHAKGRAAERDLEITITEDDIVLPETCPILGVKFDKNNKRYTYSLDRKNPNKGYTKDNVWVISHIANCMKWNSTHEERVMFAKWVLSLEGG